MGELGNTSDDLPERLDELLRSQQARRAAATSALERRYAELGVFILQVAYPAFHKLRMWFRSHGKIAFIIPPEDLDDPRSVRIEVYSNDGPEFLYSIWANVLPGQAFIVKRIVAYSRRG